MKFCPICNNMLYVEVKSVNESNPSSSDMEHGVTTLYHQCRKCGFEKEHNDEEDGPFVISSTTQQASTKDLIQSGVVNEYTKFNPTYARTNKMRCINQSCPTNDTNKSEEERLHLREIIPYCANPITLKYLFVCCICDSVWSLEK